MKRKLKTLGPHSKWWIGSKDDFDWVIKVKEDYWIIPRSPQSEKPKPIKGKPRVNRKVSNGYYWALAILGSILGVSLALNFFIFKLL